MNDEMWNIFEKTGSIEAYLYIEESKRFMNKLSNESNIEIGSEISEILSEGITLEKEDINKEN